jgi:uncharacterized protein YkwD
VIFVQHPLAVLAAAVVSGLTPLAQTADASVASGLAPRTVCQGQAAVSAPVGVQVRAMRCLINWARDHNGRSALRDQSQLDRSASLRAGDIRRCRDFSHTACGRPFTLVFTIVGYLAGTAGIGENLAFGQGRLGSARAAMAGWLASPGHRQILFDPRWRDLGLSLVKARSLFGRSNVSVWVAQFGYRGSPVLP